METNLTSQIILQHLEVSLIPWLIVTLLNVGLGYGLASLLRHWFQGRPRAIHWLDLLPWRSVAIWIALVAVNSPVTVELFGLGSKGAGVGVVVALCSLMLPWVTSAFVRSWFPPSTREKIFSVARLAAILSIVFPVFLDFGMGYFIFMSFGRGDYQNGILAYEVLGAMLLGVDIVLGIVQFVVANHQSRPSDSLKSLSLHANS